MPDIPSVTLGQTIDPVWGSLVADTLDSVQATLATLTPILVLHDWTPNVTTGGFAVPRTNEIAKFVDLGKIRLGVVQFLVNNLGGIGGLLIGNGFWQSGATIVGGFQFFELGVHNHVGFLHPYDALTVAGVVDGENNIFGVTPAVRPSDGDVLRAWILAIDP